MTSRCTGGHGFDSRRGLRFFLCLTLVTTEYSLSHFFPSLKFIIFLSLLSHTVLSTLLIVAVCRTRVTTNSGNNYDLACHKSPSSLVVKAPDQCTGGDGFDSRWGLRFFLCPTLLANSIFHLFKVMF